jgi:hypothetical protein
MMEILSYVTSFLVAIIGFFVKETMDDIKSLKKSSVEMEKKLSVIENDYLNKHSNLSSRFEELNLAVKDLTNEIKILSKEIQNKL